MRERGLVGSASNVGAGPPLETGVRDWPCPRLFAERHEGQRIVRGRRQSP